MRIRDWILLPCQLRRRSLFVIDRNLLVLGVTIGRRRTRRDNRVFFYGKYMIEQGTWKYNENWQN